MPAPPADGTGQVQVTVDVTAPGLATGTLVIESNDPGRPRIEIPLYANGVDASDLPGDTDDPLVEPDDFKADINGCGCATGPSTGAWTLAPLALLAALRRRR